MFRSGTFVHCAGVSDRCAKCAFKTMHYGLRDDITGLIVCGICERERRDFFTAVGVLIVWDERCVTERENV